MDAAVYVDQYAYKDVSRHCDALAHGHTQHRINGYVGGNWLSEGRSLRCLRLRLLWLEPKALNDARVTCK
jgi:hypothetical protein